MIEVNIDILIRKPIEAVFDQLADIPGYNHWMPASSLLRSSRQTSTGPTGEGTTFIDKTSVGRAEGEIVDYKRPWKVSFRQSIYLFGIEIGESRPGYKLEPREDYTRLFHHAEGNFYGLFRLFEPLLVIIARAERKRTINALKKSLESVD
jgi:hypothetical protein